MCYIVRMRVRRFFLIFASMFPLLLSSCSKIEVHVHDRHLFSYPLVKSYAEKQGPVTLVLIDYHHDILPLAPGNDVLASYSWVGRLLQEKLVSSVLWISGRNLELPNRDARMAWLCRSLSHTDPETEAFFKSKVVLCDWPEFCRMEIPENSVVTVDLDVCTKNPGPDPDAFVGEIAEWISSFKPELLTICLSAAYQNDSEDAWRWLSSFADGFTAESTWFLECGDFGEAPESLEETAAWNLWRENPDIFSCSACAFYPGGALWANAPLEVRNALFKKKIRAGNGEAGLVIESWAEEGRAETEKAANGKMPLYVKMASESLSASWRGEKFPSPEISVDFQNEKSLGVAVRFHSPWSDKGCLAFYGGLREEDIPAAISYCAEQASKDPRYGEMQPGVVEGLFANVCLFGAWKKMDNPTDFLPGYHSILMEETLSGNRTLLQSAIALERNYDRETFLSHLSSKAGLGSDGWKSQNLVFYKSPTVVAYKSLSD